MTITTKPAVCSAHGNVNWEGACPHAPCLRRLGTAALPKKICFLKISASPRETKPRQRTCSSRCCLKRTFRFRSRSARRRSRGTRCCLWGWRRGARRVRFLDRIYMIYKIMTVIGKILSILLILSRKTLRLCVRLPTEDFRLHLWSQPLPVFATGRAALPNHRIHGE